MIGYVTLGTNDLDRAKTFYDGLLAEIGGKQTFGMDRIQFWGTAPDQPMVAVCVPYDKEPQHCGNGHMVAIPGGDRAGVDALYAKAIELGATCGGEPGERMPTFYGAYVRDLDNNKLCFFQMG